MTPRDRDHLIADAAWNVAIEQRAVDANLSRAAWAVLAAVAASIYASGRVWNIVSVAALVDETMLDTRTVLRALAMLDRSLGAQASVIANGRIYVFAAVVILALIPLLVLIRRTKGSKDAAHLALE